MKEELTVFPKEGWCPAGSVGLGKYLSVKFGQEYMLPGVKGYAWNDYSYWPIHTESSKEKYSINHLYNLKDPNPEVVEIQKNVREYPLTSSECFQGSTSQIYDFYKRAEIYKLDRKKLLLIRRSRR